MTQSDASKNEQLEHLVERALAGDGTAWNQIVVQLENLVWSVVRGFRLNDQDAEDAAQLTWLRAVEKLHTIKDAKRVGLWLATIARRECMRIIERSETSVSVDPHIAFVRLQSKEDLCDDITNRSTAKSVIEALDAMSPNCQALLRLVLSDPPVAYRDIAELLEIAVGSIGARRARCLSKLRSATGL